MKWEEITQETRKNIVLNLRKEKYMRTGDFKRELDLASSTINHHLDKLNDLSVVHHSKEGYHLIPDKIRFERATDKYLPEFLLFIPSTAVFFSLAFYYVINRMGTAGLAIGFLSAFTPIFLKRVYEVATEEDYTRIFRKKKKEMKDVVDN